MCIPFVQNYWLGHINIRALTFIPLPCGCTYVVRIIIAIACRMRFCIHMDTTITWACACGRIHKTVANNNPDIYVCSYSTTEMRCIYSHIRIRVYVKTMRRGNMSRTYILCVPRSRMGASTPQVRRNANQIH